MKEHDFEPIRGLPGELPPGERLIWQGAPHGFGLAKHAFHIRAVAAYFAVLMLWRVIEALAGGANLGAALAPALFTAPIAVAALAMIGLLAWLNARSTVYTITSRRVVLRFGLALPKAINIPFNVIDRVALKTSADGCGDVALALTPPSKIAYLQLWPHARPWRLKAPEAAFRAICGAAGVADILASAMKAALAEAAAPAAAQAPPAEPVSAKADAVAA